MSDGNEDEFTSMLFNDLDELEKKLKGKPISVELLIQEIEFIRWALDSYRKSELVYALHRVCTDVAESRDEDITRQSVGSEIDETFAHMEEWDNILESIRSKISKAVAAASRNEKAQPGLGFGPN